MFFFFFLCVCFTSFLHTHTLTHSVMQIQTWQKEPLLRKALSCTPNQPFKFLKTTSGGSHIQDGKGGQASDDSSIFSSQRCCHDNRAQRSRPQRDGEVEGREREMR